MKTTSSDAMLNVASGQPRARTVLLVDDEVTITEVIGAHFLRLGYRVVCVSNGAEALDWLKLQRADLVVSDLHMPFVNGLELCRKLQARKNRPSPPVLLLTADGEQIETGELANLCGVVRKPFSAAQIVTRCIEVLEPSTAACDL